MLACVAAAQQPVINPLPAAPLSGPVGPSLPMGIAQPVDANHADVSELQTSLLVPPVTIRHDNNFENVYKAQDGRFYRRAGATIALFDSSEYRVFRGKGRALIPAGTVFYPCGFPCGTSAAEVERACRTSAACSGGTGCSPHAIAQPFGSYPPALPFAAHAARPAWRGHAPCGGSDCAVPNSTATASPTLAQLVSPPPEARLMTQRASMRLSPQPIQPVELVSSPRLVPSSTANPELTEGSPPKSPARAWEDDTERRARLARLARNAIERSQRPATTTAHADRSTSDQ